MTAPARKLVVVEPQELPRPDTGGGVDSQIRISSLDKKRAAGREAKRRHDALKAAGLVIARPKVRVASLHLLWELGEVGPECVPGNPGYRQEAMDAAIAKIIEVYKRHVIAAEAKRSAAALKKMR